MPINKEKITPEKQEHNEQEERASSAQDLIVKQEKREGGVFVFFKKLFERNQNKKKREEKFSDNVALTEESRILFSEKILTNPIARSLNQLFNIMTLYFIFFSPGHMYRATINQRELEEYLNESKVASKVLRLSEEDLDQSPSWLKPDNNHWPQDNSWKEWTEILVATKDILEHAGTKILSEKQIEQEIESSINYSSASSNFSSDDKNNGELNDFFDFAEHAGLEKPNKILPENRLTYFFDSKDIALRKKDSTGWKKIIAEEAAEIERS